MIIVFALGLAMGASAQHFVRGGFRGGYYGGGHIGVSHVYVAAPRVSVGVGLGYGFGYGYGYAPFYYSPFGYYPYGYSTAYAHRPSKLDMKIQDIKSDYDDKIYSAKHDNSLTRKERKETVHQLKVERDQAINDLKSNYYKN